MKIDSSSMGNSADITSAIFENFYPNGQQVVKNTSFSTEGISSRTLTSRTLSDTLAGDALYRSPKFSLAFYNKMVGSSLNSLITGGADSVFASPNMLKIKNPESPDNGKESTEATSSSDGTTTTAPTTTEEGASNSTATLVGGMALNRIIANSIVSRRGASDLVNNATVTAVADITNAQKNPDYVAGKIHGSQTYNTDIAMVSSGSRTVALASSLTSNEVGWILERGALLKSKNVVFDSGYLVSGFPFDIPDGLTGLTQTESFFEGMQTGNSIDQTIIDASSQTAYIAPALIELLIFLESKMGYRGSLGADKASRSTAQNQDYATITSGQSVNDHVFGRAFDMTEIRPKDGSEPVSLSNVGGDVTKYRTALNHFLSILNTAPLSILPDLIVIHADLGNELGVIPGDESVLAPVKIQYPNLRYVNFSADANHKNNIHFSFSPQRAGQYVGPGGVLGAPGTFLSPSPLSSNPNDPLSTIAPGSLPDINNLKFRQSYASDKKLTLTLQEVFDLYRGTFLSDEAAAIMTAISVRESNLRPALLNPNTNSGDWSIGLMQINMLAHGSKTYYMPVGGVTKTGFKLGIKDTTANDNASFKAQAKAAYANNKDNCFYLVDPICWVPLNQASLLYTLITSKPMPANLSAAEKLGQAADGPFIFGAWGEYKGGPPYGLISSVNFKDAVYAYRTTGKDPQLLKRWVLTMFQTSAAGTKAAQYASKWVEGWFYKVGWSGGWTALPPQPPTENLYPPGNYTTPALGGVPSAPGAPGGGTALPGINLPGPYAALRFAESQIGAPYAAVNPWRVGEPPWDGNTHVGFRDDVYKFPKGTIVYDCSGFVLAVYKRGGIDLYKQYKLYDSSSMDKSDFPDVPADQVQPLDIAVYYNNKNGVGHVGLVYSRDAAGNIRTIEATGNKGVAILDLKRERLGRIKKFKRVFPTGAFNPGNIAIT